MAINGIGGDPQGDGVLLPDARCYYSCRLAEPRCSTEDVHSQVPPTQPSRETQTKVFESLLQTSHVSSNDRAPSGEAVESKIYWTKTMLRNSWPSQWIIRVLFVIAMILFFFASTSSSYKCRSFDVNSIAASADPAGSSPPHSRAHATRHGRARRHGHRRGRHDWSSCSLAEIIPRDDIVGFVHDEFEVSCNYDYQQIGDQTVLFRKTMNGKFSDVPTKRVNESTISTVLQHNTTDKYILFCYVPAIKKTLCLRQINVGYEPLDILNLRCRSPNWETLDCYWDIPDNMVITTYNFSLTSTFKLDREVVVMRNKTSFTIDFRSYVGNSRPNVTVFVTGNNSLGVVNYTHPVNIEEIVVPVAATGLTTSFIGPDFVRMQWDLSHLMDSFPGKLIQEVSWRIPPHQAWTKVMDKAKYNVGSNAEHIYWEELSLPYANILYEVRVRIHTAVGAIREDYWSVPSYINVTTSSKRPEKVVLTSPSGFEVRNSLLFRDLYIYWQQVDRLHHNGPDLHYSVMAYYGNTTDPVQSMPVLSYVTFAKFVNFEYNVNYRFEITAVNAVGEGANSSEVLVPSRSLLLPVAAMFTVIKYGNPSSPRSPTYRLLWKAPAGLSEADQNDLRYVVFWCPRPHLASQCEENLSWESAGDDLDALRLRDELPSSRAGASPPAIYQRNMTGLGEDMHFGLAALRRSSSASASSGIKWASCSVFHDDSPPAPNAPTTSDLGSKSLKLSWKFECKDNSAVPLRVNISYCETTSKSDHLDFSDCSSLVKFEESDLTGPALITDLRPSATIIFAISLVTIVGESKPSPAIKVLMREDVPEGPPSSLNVTAFSNTSASIEWEAPEPRKSNGIITFYEVSTQPPTPARMYPAGSSQKNVMTLSGLSPYTRYVVSVAACTQVGCAVKHPAQTTFETDVGVPDKVNMFSVDSLGGHISWAFDNESCHGKKCSFDLEIHYNDSVVKQYNLVQNSINLMNLNVTCPVSKTMNVSLRAVGVNSDGSPIYGPWNSVERSCNVTAVLYLAWWIILGVVLTCVVVTLIVLLLTKAGFNVFHQFTKPIKVPNLATINDLKNLEKKNPQSALPTNGIVLPPGHGQVLINPGYNNTGGQKPTITGRIHHGPSIYDENKKVPLLSQTSQSSELDGAEDENDRHARNLSGNSSRSSGAGSGLSSEADSALASTGDAHDTSSAGSGDSENRYLRQVRDPWAASNLRQRSPGPYVMHGERPLKNISEGYVAVRSNPSLMGDHSLPRSGRLMSPSTAPSGSPSLSGSLQRSTPNLPTNGDDGSHPSLAFMKTPATSAGYFSTTESDPPMGDELSTVLSEMPRSRSGLSTSSGLGGASTTGPPYGAIRSPSFPAYSRYSVTPPAKQKPWGVEDTNNRNAASNLGDLRYVAVAFNTNNNCIEGDDSRLGSPESFNGSLDVKRRPPSMPSLLNVGECDHKSASVSPDLLDANSPYSVVGNNRNAIIHPVPSSQGYVTIGNQPRPHTTDNNNINNSIQSRASMPNNTSISQLSNRTDQSFSPSRVVGDSNGFPGNSQQGLFSRPDQRGPSSSSGYVTLGERGFPSANPSLRNSPPGPDPGLGSTTSSARSHYVTAAPDRWAFNAPRPKHLDMADEVRYVASAPCENLRGRVHTQKGAGDHHHDSNLSPQLSERPNTADGAGSRPKRLSQSPSTGWPSGGPSLSKQSSGYVSQEALASDPNAMISPRLFSEEHTKALRSAGLGSEPLVMSPKRLISTEPTKGIKSVGHEVSFV